MPAMALAAAGFVAIGLWAFAVSGAYELIVIGLLALGLLMLAERERRGFASRSQAGRE